MAVFAPSSCASFTRAQDPLALAARAAAAGPASRRRRRSTRRRAGVASRAALRTTSSPPGRGPTQQSSEASVFQTRSIAWSERYAWTSSSTRSAVRRSASSRSAIRLPLRKKLRAARSICSGHVDLAGLEPRQQVVGGDVDQHHFVGLVEERVGDGLPDRDAGDAADDVVQALEVLHVERREDVDARRQQLLDVLPALRMARSRRRWCARARRPGSAPDGAPAPRRGRTRGSVRPWYGDLGRAAGSRGPASSASVSLRPWVSTHADDDVLAFVAQRARRGEHRVRLADAGRGAEVDAQAAAARGRLLRLDFGEELVGIGALGLHALASCASCQPLRQPGLPPLRLTSARCSA